MAIYNLGSINADNVYRVPHLPLPGETIAATGLVMGLGGKGANMSVAAARAAARVVHIGAVGTDGRWAVQRLAEYGVGTRHIHEVDGPMGHANICIDPAGENSIVIYPGANQRISDEMVEAALQEATPGDFLVLQNETNGQPEAAKLARSLGLRVFYAAAPFDAATVSSMIPLLDFLVLNEVEAQQLTQETETEPGDLPIPDIIVTKGSAGCLWISELDRAGKHFAAIKVEPVDTTGAGDTFTGFLIAGLDRGMTMVQAIDLATRAAALMVTRVGTADVIPDLQEVLQTELR